MLLALLLYHIDSPIKFLLSVIELILNKMLIFYREREHITKQQQQQTEENKYTDCVYIEK